MAGELSLLAYWPSPFALRVKIALAEKGIVYESIEENLMIKSPLLQKMNPIKKQIPVLIHNGKPICESLVIVQYIDEVWNDESHLLSSDPYKRAQAMFWVDYIDKKIYSNGRSFLFSKGESQDAAKKELIECFKVLEAELGEKTYFGGESLGIVDIALVPFYNMFKVSERLGKLNMEEECPIIAVWAKRCMDKDSVSKTLPEQDKLFDFMMMMAKKHGSH